MRDLDDDDQTVAELPIRPCQRCFAEPWQPPHSIGANCIAEQRERMTKR